MTEPSFQGVWFTTFGRLSVTEDGGVVRGTYEHKGGVLEGTTQGRVLSGRWREGDRGGPCELVRDEVANGFQGTWRQDGDASPRGAWTGVRLELLPEDQGGSPAGWNSHAEGPILAGPM